MGIKAKLVAAFGLHMLAWLAMLTVLAGLLFCAAGVYMAIVPALGPMPAAFITGGGLIAIVVVAIVIAILTQRDNKRSDSKQLRSNPDNMLEQQMRPVLGDKATDWAKQNTAVAIVGALSAGVLLAASPRLRSTLVRATGPLVTRKVIQAVQGFSDNR